LTFRGALNGEKIIDDSVREYQAEWLLSGCTKRRLAA
jgi:hypothetical protein